MASRASFTHPGQSESVCLGHPSVGLVFSQDLSNGFSDHFGVNEALGLNLLKNCSVSKATPAVLLKAKSTSFKACEPAPTFLGMLIASLSSYEI
jgi:hypothetical protein